MVIFSIIASFVFSILLLWGITNSKPTKQDFLLVAIVIIIANIFTIGSISLKKKLENNSVESEEPKEALIVEDIDYGRDFFKCIDKVERFEYDGQVYIKFTKDSDFEIVPDLIEYD